MKSAVLFITYRRLDTARRVFESIRTARPPRLYFASNASNPKNPGESAEVSAVRSLIQEIDWDCEVQTLIRDRHLDVRASVAGAIDWFFSHELEGVILEDDCLASEDFYDFCDAMLERYREFNDVAVVSGTCRQPAGFENAESYYFSKYVHVWGWATWRRTWADYDRQLAFWPEWRESRDWQNRFTDPTEERYWRSRFDSTHAGETVTWDYQLMASVWKSGALTVTPAVNLVSNIGFGDGATFTRNTKNPLSAMPTFPIFPLVHPPARSANVVADKFDFDYRFNGRLERFPFKMTRRIGRFIRQKLVDPIYLRLGKKLTKLITLR